MNRLREMIQKFYIKDLMIILLGLTAIINVIICRETDEYISNLQNQVKDLEYKNQQLERRIINLNLQYCDLLNKKEIE